MPVCFQNYDTFYKYTGIGGIRIPCFLAIHLHVIKTVRLFAQLYALRLVLGNFSVVNFTVRKIQLSKISQSVIFAPRNFYRAEISAPWNLWGQNFCSVNVSSWGSLWVWYYLSLIFYQMITINNALIKVLMHI